MSDGAFTLIGVVFGFLLGFGGDVLKSRLQEHKRTQSVRLLVRLELQKNIDGMNAFWAKVRELPPTADWTHSSKRFFSANCLSSCCCHRGTV